jgi:hypothetical protein
MAALSLLRKWNMTTGPLNHFDVITPASAEYLKLLHRHLQYGAVNIEQSKEQIIKMFQDTPVTQPMTDHLLYGRDTIFDALGEVLAQIVTIEIKELKELFMKVDGLVVVKLGLGRLQQVLQKYFTVTVIEVISNHMNYTISGIFVRAQNRVNDDDDPVVISPSLSSIDLMWDPSTVANPTDKIVWRDYNFINGVLLAEVLQLAQYDMMKALCTNGIPLNPYWDNTYYPIINSPASRDGDIRIGVESAIPLGYWTMGMPSEYGTMDISSERWIGRTSSEFYALGPVYIYPDSPLMVGGLLIMFDMLQTPWKDWGFVQMFHRGKWIDYDDKIALYAEQLTIALSDMNVTLSTANR